jgi:hypothetical protein
MERSHNWRAHHFGYAQRTNEANNDDEKQKQKRRHRLFSTVSSGGEKMRRRAKCFVLPILP